MLWSYIALNSTQFNLSRILGPSIAGVLMASLGIDLEAFRRILNRAGGQAQAGDER